MCGQHGSSPIYQFNKRNFQCHHSIKLKQCVKPPPDVYRRLSCCLYFDPLCGNPTRSSQKPKTQPDPPFYARNQPPVLSCCFSLWPGHGNQPTILIFVLAQVIITVVFLSFALLIIGLTLGAKTNNDVEKRSPFECGFSPKSNRRTIFSLQFFLVALIFLIFDIELILIFPYLGVSSYTDRVASLTALLGFVIILSVGFI